MIVVVVSGDSNDNHVGGEDNSHDGDHGNGVS